MPADGVEAAGDSVDGGSRGAATAPTRRRHRVAGGPLLAGLLPLAVVAITLGGFGLAARSSAAPVSWGELLQEQPLVVPADPPPGLIDLWSTSSADPPLPAITWYSRNQALVSLCLGQVEACRSRMGMADVIRSERVGGHQVTIGVVRPGAATTMDGGLLRYWQTVPLVDVSGQPARRPAWLAEDSTLAGP